MDVVEVTRQLLANRFIDVYTILVHAFNSSTAAVVSSTGKTLLELLHDIDTLLATDENHLLSSWIADARGQAHGNASYAAYLEFNARNQITLWGPDGEIDDYASKQWAGLVGTYYVTRWQAFVSYLVQVKASGSVYNATLVAEKMLAIGQAWDKETLGKSDSTEKTKGDTFSVVDALLKRWV